MIEITAVKLKADGASGMEVTLKKPVQKNGELSIREVKETIKDPISDEIEECFIQLKYYFLNLTKHWRGSWTDLMNEELTDLVPVGDDENIHGENGRSELLDVWDESNVIVFQRKSSSFMMNGKIASVGSKVCNIGTPWVKETDDFDFYDSVMRVAENLFKHIEIFMTENVKMIESPKVFLLAAAKDDDQREAIEEMSEEDAILKARDLLENTGHMVLGEDDLDIGPKELVSGDAVAELLENENVVNESQRNKEVEEAEEEKEEKEEEKEKLEKEMDEHFDKKAEEEEQKKEEEEEKEQKEFESKQDGNDW